MVLEVQKLASHIIQVIHAEPMFANYFYLDQVKNRRVPAAITHNLIYQLFSIHIKQEKKTDEEVQSCFDRFCETLLEQINLDEFKDQKNQTIISSMVNQYENLTYKTMPNTFKKEPSFTFLIFFPKTGHELWSFRWLPYKNKMDPPFKLSQAVRDIGIDTRKDQPKKEGEV